MTKNASKTQITSIYAEINAEIKGQKSLARVLQDLPAAFVNTELTTLFLEYLQAYNTDQFNVNNVDETPQIIANAAMLFRFQVEVIEILSSNNNLDDENQKNVINNLFGKGTEYEKLYNEYYKEDGLVKRGQKHFENIGILPLFAGVIPKSFEGKNQVQLDDLEKTFKEIKDVKQTMGIEKNSHTVNLLTTHLDKGNTEATMLGLVMSEPRQLGALFAMIGNKEKKGQIDIVQDKSSHIGKNTIKGIGKSALRCLFVVAILGAFVAAGYFAAPAVAGFLGLTAIAPAVVSTVVSVVSSIIGFTAIAYIDKKAGEEVRHTYDYQPGSIGTNFGGLGISSDNVTRYTLAPIYQGMMQDKQKAMTSEVEKRANNIATNIYMNRQLINKTYGGQHRENIDQITKHMTEVLEKFGINYNRKFTREK